MERNVLGGGLEPCGIDPLTGFYRDGCCRTGPEDHGSHTICAVVTSEFLEHQQGIGNYLKSYAKPTVIMLPFNIIGELSRTLALVVRLFGNMMSGAMIIGILLTITPFIFPIVMTVLGLLTGMVQAYIFSILATVYIAAATRVNKPKPQPA